MAHPRAETLRHALEQRRGAVAHPGVYEIAVGTPLPDVLALAGGATRIADGHGVPADLERLGRFTRHVRGRGACRHPDGAAAFVESAMRVFQHEIVLPRPQAVAG